MKTILYIIIALHFATNLNAELSLVSYSDHPTVSCRGFLVTSTSGTAGPFEIQMIALDSYDPFTTLTNVSGRKVNECSVEYLFINLHKSELIQPQKENSYDSNARIIDNLIRSLLKRTV